MLRIWARCVNPEHLVRAFEFNQKVDEERVAK